MSQGFLGQAGQALALTGYHKQVMALGTAWISPGRAWPQGTLRLLKEAGPIQVL